MTYVRMSIAIPCAGKAGEAIQLMHEINNQIADTTGCINTFVIQPQDETGEIIRVAVFRDYDSHESERYVESIDSFSNEIDRCLAEDYEEKAFFSQ